MGRVRDLERQRVERLAAELGPVLRARGAVVIKIANVESVERWRRAARRAGRLLGWRVRTGVTDDGERVWAASDDWRLPPGADETATRVLETAIFGDRTSRPK